jgi:hypothetical protein
MNPSTPDLTTWRRVWRDGIAPQLTTKGLQGLKAALVRNDPRLITGAICYPPPLLCMQHQPVQQCCPLSWALLEGHLPEAVSVGPLEQRFAECCWTACERLGEPGAIRYFLNAVDEWSRDELRQNLLPEVDWALTQQDQAPPPEPLAPLARLLAESIRLAQKKRNYGT